ncbi:MAG: hypothetical protein WD512_07750, partial [Candidatus Paceibacterota bacterium]
MKNLFKLTLLTLTINLTITGLAFAGSLEEIASPVSNPVNFEDPRIQSNIKPLYVHHKIDNNFVTGGGDVDIYALQIRYALT